MQLYVIQPHHQPNGKKDDQSEHSTPDSFAEKRRKHHNFIGPV